jgi:hypothetical protein
MPAAWGLARKNAKRFAPVFFQVMKGVVLPKTVEEKPNTDSLK